MGYAVYHVEKGKGGSGGIGNHIDRVKGMEHTYPHANPELRNENIIVALHNQYHEKKLSDAIAERIKEGYNGKRKIRDNAVKFCTHILTGSHEEMKDIFADEKTAKAWINENAKFLADEFGSKNIVRFVVHLDEKTPHIHAVTVPLTEDGRLSAKELIGNRKAMQERQDRYAERMKPFELQRGIRSTGIRHEGAKEYYARMERAGKISPNLDDFKKSTLLGKVLDEDKIKYAITALKTAYEDAQADPNKNKEKLRKKIQETERELKYFRNGYDKADMANRELQLKANRLEKALKDRDKKVITELAKNPELYKKLREEYLKQLQEQAQKKSRGFSR